jgi:hypothetical protein
LSRSRSKPDHQHRTPCTQGQLSSHSIYWASDGQNSTTASTYE